MMEMEIQKEENENKKKNNKIEILKREYDEVSTMFQENKEGTTKQMKDLESKLFNEQHTKDILAEERAKLNDKISKLKAKNQQDGRTITKDKFHNSKDEVAKERKLQLDAIQTKVDEASEKCEIEQSNMENDKERNLDPQLEQKQKEKTGNILQDHNKLSTDITVAENRIKDLETRRAILYSSI